MKILKPLIVSMMIPVSLSAWNNDLRSGQPTFEKSALSENQRSAFFDGVGDRIRVTDTAPLNPSGTPSAYKITGSAITVEAWVFLTGLPAENSESIIIARPGTTATGSDPWFSYALNIHNYDGTPRFNFHLSESVPGSSFLVKADTIDVVTGKWYHIAGTYDGTNAKIYIDGELKNSINYAGKTLAEGATGLYIGGFTYGYFKGLIDEVKLWNVTRSAGEIADTKNSTLNGDETGLAGYWPLDSTYVSGNNTLTPDMTANKNDLAVQFDTKLVDFPQGSDVFLAPKYISLTKNYGLSGINVSGYFTTDGFPAPTYSVTSAPQGFANESSLYSWTPGENQYGNFEIILTATNNGGSVTDTVYIYIDNFYETSNANKLTVTNRGKIGTWSNYEKGLITGGKNGLYLGDFSLVDAKNAKYAGGLFTVQNSFRPLSAFQSVTSSLDGFTAMQSAMDDGWESNRINIKVLQTVYSNSSGDDSTYSFIEYKIINTSGAVLDSIYTQFTADFDFQSAAQSGFDFGKYLTFSSEDSKANNPNYYGFSLVNQAVTGNNIWTNGSDPQYVRSTANLKNFTSLPIAAGDHRNQLNAGPFTINTGDTLTVVYALAASSELKTVEDAVNRAKVIYRNNTVENKHSLFVDGTGDRARVLDGSPVSPNANQNAYKDYTTCVTFEADVFATAYPPANTFDEIIIRPGAYLVGAYNNGSESKFMFRVYDTNNGWIDAFASAPYDLGDWYHLSATFDGSTVKFYVNGNLQATESFTNTPNPGATGLYIGRYVGTNTGFNGLIDNVRIWSYAMGPDDINGNMNLPLLGTEAGLTGFWPFESFYLVGENTVTPDLTANHNDLIVQFDSKLLPFPVGSEVIIKPSAVSVSNLSVINGTEYSATVTSDGWPLSSFTSNSIPVGMTLNNGTLSWSVPAEAYGIYYLDIKASNTAGSVDFINSLFVESMIRTSNLTTVDVAARGKLGFFVDPQKGVFFGGTNGLAGADFSLVDKNDTKFAGGLYSRQNSFRPTSAITSAESSLTGFDAYVSTMDDAWETNRINVKVIQTVHTKSTEPDNQYSILEYKIINTSGATIDEIYPQFTADFDIGVSVQNVGAYLENLQLTYSHSTDENLKRFYGFQLLNQTATGYTMFANGTDGNYVRSTVNLSEKGTAYNTPMDYRNQINAGPFTLAADETLTVAYAIMAGDDIDDLVFAGTAAKSAYHYAGQSSNTASGYFNFAGDRIRTQSGLSVNPNANLGALSDYSNGITAEAWVFIKDLPRPNSEQIIVARPIAAGNPFQIYNLRFANFNQQNYPTLEFIISDGVTKDNWGYAGITVDESYIGKWIHVAGTYDNSTVRLYVDGHMVGSNSYNKTLGTNGAGVYIGGGFSYGYLRGLIDDVRLWNYARSEEQIASLMNYTLEGSEQGLNGYWPLDQTYQATLNNASVNVTPDLSPGKNDLVVNGLTRLVGSTAGENVDIAPKYMRLSDNYIMTGVPYKQRVITDGWPKPTVQLNNPIGGMAILNDSLTVTLNEQFWGEYYIKSTLSNAAGSNSDSTFTFVALTKQLGTNQQTLTFMTQGTFGSRGRGGLGLSYKGKNGLFSGNLGIVSKSENKLSGGLYNQPEFTYEEGIKPSSRTLSNFNSSHELNYTDLAPRNINPIGVAVRQTVLQKNTSPDDKYSIVEFSVKNISGKDLPGIYIQLGSDFDIGNPVNNMGGYDAERQLSYAFEANTSTNPYYYGMSLLDEKVSGHMVTYNGVAGNDAFGIAATDSMAEIPTTAGDVRNSIFAGPFNLINGDSVIVAFAYLTGDNLTDIQSSADAAKLAYGEIATGIADNSKPGEFSLGQNYPNPFNPTTKIYFTVGAPAHVTVEIYDLLGRKVAAILNQDIVSGTHSAVWNGKNDNGSSVSSGIYIYRMTAAGKNSGDRFVQSRKMIMLK